MGRYLVAETYSKKVISASNKVGLSVTICPCEEQSNPIQLLLTQCQDFHFNP